MTICRVMQKKRGLVHVQVLDNGHLCWSNLQVNKVISLSSHVKSIPIDDILHVKIRPNNRRLPNNPGLAPANPSLRTHQLVVHHVKCEEKKRLRMGTCIMTGTKSECQTLANDINDNRQQRGVLKEDRRLLVLINPASGKRKALVVFRHQFEPLLKACEIAYDTIVSTQSGQLADVVKTHALESYDGIVVIGGDGSLSEVFNGLLCRKMREAGHDVNNHLNDVVPVTVPIGAIPAGSGNWVVNHVNGTSDVITSIINIIRGRTVPMNAVSTHTHNKLLHFSSLVSHIGFLGDLVHLSEQNRWMGGARYAVTGHLALLRRRIMTATVTMYDPPETSSSLAMTGPDPQQQIPVTHIGQAVSRVGRKSQPSHGGNHQTALDKTQKDQVSLPNPVGETSTDSPAFQHTDEHSGSFADVSAEPFLSTTDCTERFQSDTDGIEGTAYFHSNIGGTESTRSNTGGTEPSRSNTGGTDPARPNTEPSNPNTDSTEPSHPNTEPSRSNCAGLEAFCSKRMSSSTTGTLSGEMYNIFFSITQLMTERGTLKPSLGKDVMCLQVAMKSSLPDFLKYLTKLRDNTPGMDSGSSVYCTPVKAVQLSLASKEGQDQPWYLNSDGESIPITAKTCYIRLHPRVLTMFGSKTEL